MQVVYLSAMLRKSGFSPTKLESSMAPLVSALWKLPPPKAAPAEAPLQLQVAHIDEDPYKGRLVLGKLQAGVLTPQRTVGIASVALQSDGTSSLSVRKGPSSLSLIPSLSQGLPAVVQSQEASASASGDAFAFPANFNALLRYEGMELRPLELPDLSSAPEFGSASSSLQGDIVVLSGLSEEVRVGDTVVDLQVRRSSFLSLKEAVAKRRAPSDLSAFLCAEPSAASQHRGDAPERVCDSLSQQLSSGGQRRNAGRSQGAGGGAAARAAEAPRSQVRDNASTKAEEETPSD